MQSDNATNLNEQTMKDREYKDVWNERKLYVMTDYVRLVYTKETPKNIEILPGRIEQLKKYRRIYGYERRK